MIGWRIGLYVGVLLAIASAGAYVVHLRDKAARVDAAEARAAQIAAESAQQLRQLESERNAAQEASDSYAEELIALRTARQPARVVRLCPDTKPAVPVAPAAPGRADEAAAGTGALSAEPRPDVGPDLYADADRADELAAQLRALQQWVAAWTR